MTMYNFRVVQNGIIKYALLLILALHLLLSLFYHEYFQWSEHNFHGKDLAVMFFTPLLIMLVTQLELRHAKKHGKVGLIHNLQLSFKISLYLFITLICVFFLSLFFVSPI